MSETKDVRAQWVRSALADIIRAHLRGVDPQDQSVVLEDRDWDVILAALEPAPKPAGGELVARITNYLASGGFFNPELMEPAKVRDLLIDCRNVLFSLDAALPQGEDVGSVVAELRRGKLFYESSGGSVYAGSTKLGRKAADLIEAQAAQIASLSAKVAEVEGERDKLSRELDISRRPKKDAACN